MVFQSQPVVFGEVLFDQFPDGVKKLGGAPFNVAWNLNGFDVKPLFVTRIGNDDNGANVMKQVEDWDMVASGIQRDSEHPTGRVIVEIKDNEPSYDIEKNCAYDFISKDELSFDAKALKNTDNTDDDANPLLLYHGSLCLRTATARDALDALTAKLASDLAIPVERFVDINLRSPHWSFESVNELLQHAEVTMVKINHEELDHMQERQVSEQVPEHDTIVARAKEFLDTYKLKLLIVTMGAQGALVLDKSGLKAKVKPGDAENCGNDDTNKRAKTEPVEVVDTVGAGDAFASVVILGLLKGWPIESTVVRAQQFASCVVGIRGALMKDKQEYKAMLESWENVAVEA